MEQKMNSNLKVNQYILTKLKNYRVQLIQDIKHHYANIIILHRVVVTAINVNLLTVLRSLDQIQANP